MQFYSHPCKFLDTGKGRLILESVAGLADFLRRIRFCPMFFEPSHDQQSDFNEQSSSAVVFDVQFRRAELCSGSVVSVIKPSKRGNITVAVAISRLKVNPEYFRYCFLVAGWLDTSNCWHHDFGNQ